MALYSTSRVSVAAGSSEVLELSAAYLRCLDADGEFKLSLNDGPAAEAFKGWGLRLPAGETLVRVRVENPGALALSVLLGYGTAEIEDSRASFADAIPVGAAPHLVTGPDASVPAGGTALLAASDPSRREIMIQNRSANARELRIGDSGAAAAEGIELQPGETWRMAVTGDVYAYNPHTAAAVVAVAVITG